MPLANAVHTKEWSAPILALLFFGYDGHGSARLLTNSAGTITDGYDFDAFGMPIRTSGTSANTDEDDERLIGR